MDVMTAKEAAKKWGVTQRRVSTLCSENRIEGVEFIGNMWLIPKSARKPEDGRIIRFDPLRDMAVKPFLKWAGGKSQILGQIRDKYPNGLGVSITKYAEPFAGGGAVLFDILPRADFKEVYISDINHELISTYMLIQRDVSGLINILKPLEVKYLASSEDARREIYYGNRERFNVLKALGSESAETAALFIFLNKTCFNGLYRVNSHGAFNVPQGSYKNPNICDEANLLAVSAALQKVQIVCGDYKLSRGFIDKHTFAYFDPPYRPLSVTASFTAYASNNFGDKEQAELARFIDEMSDKGAYIVASNSDPKNIDENDDFFDLLYSRHSITRINASRVINSVGASRGQISELLIAGKRDC